MTTFMGSRRFFLLSVVGGLCVVLSACAPKDVKLRRDKKAETQRVKSLGLAEPQDFAVSGVYRLLEAKSIVEMLLSEQPEKAKEDCQELFPLKKNSDGKLLNYYLLSSCRRSQFARSSVKMAAQEEFKRIQDVAGQWSELSYRTDLPNFYNAIISIKKNDKDRAQVAEERALDAYLVRQVSEEGPEGTVTGEQVLEYFFTYRIMGQITQSHFYYNDAGKFEWTLRGTFRVTIGKKPVVTMFFGVDNKKMDLKKDVVFNWQTEREVFPNSKSRKKYGSDEKPESFQESREWISELDIRELAFSPSCGAPVGEMEFAFRQSRNRDSDKWIKAKLQAQDQGLQSDLFKVEAKWSECKYLSRFPYELTLLK